MAQLRPLLTALALGAAGGFLFATLKLPLAWMMGAMCANTLAAMAGIRIGIPVAVRNAFWLVLGVMLGGSFTPAVLAGAGEWWLTLLALVPFTLGVTVVTSLYLRKAARFDPATAYFAASPGGMMEMTALGVAAGGDGAMIALVHAMRLFVVVLVLPLAFRFTMDAPPTASSAVPTLAFPLRPEEALLLLCCGILGFWLARRLKVPAAPLIGPLAFSALVHATGFSEASPPSLLVATAQVVLGAYIGTRFSGIKPRRVAAVGLVALGSIALQLLAAAAAAGGLSAVQALPFAQILLAYSPGGVAEMSLIALALDLQSAFVSTHHLARIFLVVAAVAPVWTAWLRWRTRNSGDGKV